MRRAILAIFVLVIVAGFAALAAGCGGYSSPAPSGSTGGASSGSSGGGATPSGPNTITEQNYQFTPSSLTVAPGATVTFVNQDSVAHRVVVGSEDLGDQQPGASVTWTAKGSGVVPVKCTIHPSMTGQITVSSAGTAPAPAAPGGSNSAPPATGGSGGGSAPIPGY